MSTNFWDVQISDVIEVAILALTCWVIWHGPLKAIRVSREITRSDDAHREAQRRKYHVFHELMRTRGVVLHPQHVMALNLIQLEFYGNAAVQDSYRAYIEHLNMPSPTDEGAARAINMRRRDLLFDLLHAIGVELGMTFDKRELERLSYSPQGWATEEDSIRTVRDFAIQVMTGQRAVHIAPFGGPDPRYPPKPEPPRVTD